MFLHVSVILFTGGMSGSGGGGVCLWVGRRVISGSGWGVCLWVWGGVCLWDLGRHPPRQTPPPLGRHPSQADSLGDSHYSGRYPSYWNGFLLQTKEFTFNKSYRQNKYCFGGGVGVTHYITYLMHVMYLPFPPPPPPPAQPQPKD